MKTSVHLHEDLCTVISRRILRKMRNISDKSYREKQNTLFVFQKCLSENRAFCEIMWKNIPKPGKPQMTIWRTRIACWIHKLRICNINCFSTSTVVARMRLYVTLYARYLPR
jgi:hypothetical protein